MLPYYYEDIGYCKFGDKCRKQHFKTVCSNPECDKSCKSRHPRICKFKEKCKFFAKKICAYKHVTLACDDSELNALKKQVETLKLENEAKLSTIVKLDEEIETFKFKIEAVEKEKEISTKLVNELKETIALLEKENVDLRVQNIIQQKIIVSHADQRESESYNCEICDFECNEEDALETHKELFHENEKPENYPCDRCDFDYDEEDDLAAQNEIYHENRCDRCDTTFALQTHNKIYHDNRCNTCDFESTTKKV